MNETVVEASTNITEAKPEILDLTPEEMTGKAPLDETNNGTVIAEDEDVAIEYLASEQYIKDLQSGYEEAVLAAAARLIRGEISAEEQARLTIGACMELSEGVQQHVALVEQLEREEEALVAFDNNLAEQLRIMRKLDREAKARKAELRRQQRTAQQQAEIERLTASYNKNAAEINEVESRVGGPKL